jgi:hypothetical protein
MNWREQLPLGRSLLIVFLSTLLISGTAALTLLYLEQLELQRSRDPDYQVRVLLQTSSRREPLPSLYLEELLGLSQDQPLGLYQMDLKEAQRRLLASPLIAAARLKRLPPDTLWVDYDVREPVAYLADFSEVALDAQGVAIPVRPFTTPKQLPEIYVGGIEASGVTWGQPVDSIHIEPALQILRQLTEKQPISTLIRRIDLADNWGSNGQILVLVEDEVTSRAGTPCRAQQWLRLSSTCLEQGWNNYRALRPRLLEQFQAEPSTAPILVDLRLPTIAYWKYDDRREARWRSPPEG